MNSQTLQLVANLHPQPKWSCHSLNARQLKNKLLAMGYENMELSGALINQFCEGVYLWIEDDAEFLIEYYLHLEEILLQTTEYEHCAFLSDGLLQSSAKSNSKTVTIKFEYCPGLDVANLIMSVATVTTDEYVWWWRSIAYAILRLTRD